MKQLNGGNLLRLTNKIFHPGSELGILKKKVDAYREQAREQAGDQSLSSGKRSATSDQSRASFVRWIAGRFDVPYTDAPIFSARLPNLLGHCIDID